MITMISTVGYGDRYPVTFEGRVIAASLMVAGIVDRTESTLVEVLARLRQISARLDVLERDRRSS